MLTTPALVRITGRVLPRLGCGLAILLALAIWSGRASAEDQAAKPYAISIFGGPGSKLDFTGTVKHLPAFENSSDKILGITLQRRLLWITHGLSLDGELMFAHHFGRQVYEEVGTGLYAHWHDFPWNSYVLTTAGIGIGPSYTTIYPEQESDPGAGHRSRVLNQLNAEFTFALPSHPDTSLLLRMQHRSGVFGLIDGGWGSSNFLTLGLRQHF